MIANASQIRTDFSAAGRKQTDQVVAQGRRIISISKVSLSLLHRLHAAVDGPHQSLLSVTLATTTTSSTTITQKQSTKTLPRSEEVWLFVWVFPLCGSLDTARQLAGGSFLADYL